MKRIFKSIRVLFVFVGILLCLPLLVGCSEDEYKGEGPEGAIQFTINGSKCKNNMYKVSTLGGEYLLKSKNYGSLWLCSIDEGTERVWSIDNEDHLDIRKIPFERDWYRVQYDDQNNIVFYFQAMPVGVSSRSLTIGVRSGNTFGTFEFYQE